MIIFLFCIFIWILTRNLNNIASTMFRFMRSCRMSRIQLWASITRSIDFWISASITRSRKNQRSSWSSSLLSRTHLLTKFNQSRNQRSRTSSSSSSRCVLSAKKDIIQQANIVSSLISSEIVINLTKKETNETANASEKTTTTTTKDSIRRSMTKKKKHKIYIVISLEILTIMSVMSRHVAYWTLKMICF